MVVVVELQEGVESAINDPPACGQLSLGETINFKVFPNDFSTSFREVVTV